MTEKGRETLRDVVMIASLMISLASVGGVMLAQSNASAQWVQKTDSRLEKLEGENAQQADTLKKRGRFVNDSTNQLNYLCATKPECRALYAPIVVPE